MSTDKSPKTAEKNAPKEAAYVDPFELPPEQSQKIDAAQKDLAVMLNRPPQWAKIKHWDQKLKISNAYAGTSFYVYATEVKSVKKYNENKFAPAEAEDRWLCYGMLQCNRDDNPEQWVPSYYPFSLKSSVYADYQAVKESKKAEIAAKAAEGLRVKCWLFVLKKPAINSIVTLKVEPIFYEKGEKVFSFAHLKNFVPIFDCEKYNERQKTKAEEDKKKASLEEIPSDEELAPKKVKRVKHETTDEDIQDIPEEDRPSRKVARPKSAPKKKVVVEEEEEDEEVAEDEEDEEEEEIVVPKPKKKAVVASLSKPKRKAEDEIVMDEIPEDE